KTSLPHQLQEFAHQLTPSEPLQLDGTRCSLCNTPLILTDSEKIRFLQSKLRNEIHEKTLKHHKDFWYCPKCYQAYWKGRQWDRISETLKKINAERKNSI
ncbi:MAG: Mut7-C RNAse domain-containing protein, partial [Candidatus Ranarchaeia archaeon]